MERIQVMVPPPMVEDIETYRDSQGFENQSQAVRDLIRRGIDGAD